MIKFIYPTQSCTLYSNYDILNTGADEILEVASDFTPTKGPMAARSLLLFSNEDILVDFKTTNRYILNLRIVQSVELESNVELEAYPVSEKWDAGKGRFSDTELLYPGASWLYKNENKDTWTTTTSVEYDAGGGSWYDKFYDNELDEESTLDFKFKFETVASDVKIDITQLVSFWNMSAIENNGIILKFKDDVSKRCGNVKFFSSNTNTIYRPYIEVGGHDYKFEPYIITTTTKNSELLSGSLDSGSLDSGSLDSGSLEESTTDNTEQTKSLESGVMELKNKDLHIFIENIKESYSHDEIEKLVVGVRELNPKKNFSNRMRYTGRNITSLDMFFSVLDAETEEIIIDFSEFTKISCDTNGHYFNFDFSCLSRGRLYKFILKLEHGGIRKKYDNKLAFMITN
jgi:hypothetical protein